MRNLEQRFARLKHFLGTFLPSNLDAIKTFQSDLVNKLQGPLNENALLKEVSDFRTMIYSTPTIRMYFEQMIEQVSVPLEFSLIPLGKLDCAMH